MTHPVNLPNVFDEAFFQKFPGNVACSQNSRHPENIYDGFMKF